MFKHSVLVRQRKERDAPLGATGLRGADDDCGGLRRSECPQPDAERRRGARIVRRVSDGMERRQEGHEICRAKITGKDADWENGRSCWNRSRSCPRNEPTGPTCS